MDNEENRGLINKNDSEDKLLSFGKFSFGALIILSGSLSHTLEHLEYYWSTLGECGILGARRQRKNMKSQEDIRINDYN